MNKWTRRIPAAFVAVTCAIAPLQALAAPVSEETRADESKMKQGAREVERGGKQVGEGVVDTAKGVGKTVAGGAETAGDKIKDAGEAAKPAAKNAWSNVRDGAVSFGHSVKTFFSRLVTSSVDRKGS